MSDKCEADDRWSLLEQAATVLDEPFHRQTVETTLLAAAKCARKLEAELARLRLAIRRLAEQDATLSVQGGNVIVEMDATLTDAEREAIDAALGWCDDRDTKTIATLRGLLERLTPRAE